MVKNKKQKRYVSEILELRSARRRDVLAMIACIVAVIIVILGKSYLDAEGILDPGNALFAGLQWMIAVGLALAAGFAGRDFSKAGRRIQELCDMSGMTKEDIKSL